MRNKLTRAQMNVLVDLARPNWALSITTRYNRCWVMPRGFEPGGGEIGKHTAAALLAKGMVQRVASTDFNTIFTITHAGRRVLAAAVGGRG